LSGVTDTPDRPSSHPYKPTSSEAADRALANFVVNTDIDALRSHQANTTLAKLVDGYLVRCTAQGRATLTI